MSPTVVTDLPEDAAKGKEGLKFEELLDYGISREDLAAAKSWAIAAEETNHGSALLAYQTALKFLDQHVALLSSLSRHFDVIRMAMASLAVDALSCSICHCALTIAVELVEQGHAVFWTQLARLSLLFDGLFLPGDTGTALVEEFKQLSSCLHTTFDQSTEDQSSHIRQLAIKWNNVLSHIHVLPDFSHFLLPPLFLGYVIVIPLAYTTSQRLWFLLQLQSFKMCR
ncbi:hypothetical protein BD769DRAFT_1737503 [Suillus cothurnatus]|nr:hypothetical protein BD769DRAFT_1737503 [Suillus cothurnatus]